MGVRMMIVLAALVVMVLLAAGCVTPPAGDPPAAAGAPRVLAVATFLAEIAQNVAGDRLRVDALVPSEVDPHGFVPAPADVRKVTESQVLIVNGAGFETFIDRLLENAGGTRHVIEASAGLQGREPQGLEAELHADEDEAHETDPHFWLDPSLVVRYVENIRDGLSAADPAGAETYAANAESYIAELQELDRWIAEQVSVLPAEQRRLVTNHESFGYFADRYGFTVVGTVLPSVSTGTSPSAQQLAALIDTVKQQGVRAVFLETGANAQLANQLARDTGIKVVTGLFTHSVTGPDGVAPTYIDMMRYNTKAIVEALK